MTYNVTLVIILVTLLVSLAGFGNPRLIEGLIFWPPAVRRGQWYRLFSYGLIHANFQHLLFNMITLYFFGTVIETLYLRSIGIVGYVLFYLGALLFSILPTYQRHKDDPDYRSLGASGAVAAVLFAFILIRPWAMIIVFVLPVPAILFAVAYVAYTIWMDRRATDKVNHSAHLWGAAYGIAVTLALEPTTLRLFLDQLMHPVFN